MMKKLEVTIYYATMNRRTRIILEVVFGPKTTDSRQDRQWDLKTCISLHGKGLLESQYTT